MSNARDETSSAAEYKSPKANALKDRKASKGDRYAHDNNGTAEGNDPARERGDTFTREVPDPD